MESEILKFEAISPDYTGLFSVRNFVDKVVCEYEGGIDAVFLDIPRKSLKLGEDFLSKIVKRFFREKGGGGNLTFPFLKIPYLDILVGDNYLSCYGVTEMFIGMHQIAKDTSIQNQTIIPIPISTERYIQHMRKTDYAYPRIVLYESERFRKRLNLE